MKPRALVYLLAGPLVVLSVGACSGLLPNPPEVPPASFLLAPELSEVRPGSPFAGAGAFLLVSRPEPGAGYGTQRMAYMEQDFRLDYFADHQWVDPPAAMLAPLLVKVLDDSPVFGAVSGDARGMRADLRLDTVIEGFHQDFRTRPSRARVALRVRLMDPGDGRILATQLFEGTQIAPADTAYGGVQAINGVLSRLLPEIAAFAAREASRPRSPAHRDPGQPPH